MTANILFLSSNPQDQPSLDVIDECKLVDIKLKEAQHNEYVELIAEHPISTADLQGILLRYQPDIVHFSGHGTQRGELVFENSDGVTEIVPPVALAELFDIITRTTRISRLYFLLEILLAQRKNQWYLVEKTVTTRI